MSQQTATLEAVLNLNQAMGNMDGDAELLREVMEMFLEMLPDQIQSLEGRIATRDVENTAMEAHGMKGAASNICAVKFVHTAYELEQLAKGGSLEGAEELLAGLKENFAELQEVAQVINWDEVLRAWQN